MHVADKKIMQNGNGRVHYKLWRNDRSFHFKKSYSICGHRCIVVRYEILSKVGHEVIEDDWHRWMCLWSMLTSEYQLLLWTTPARSKRLSCYCPCSFFFFCFRLFVCRIFCTHVFRMSDEVCSQFHWCDMAQPCSYSCDETEVRVCGEHLWPDGRVCHPLFELGWIFFATVALRQLLLLNDIIYKVSIRGENPDDVHTSQTRDDLRPFDEMLYLPPCWMCCSRHTNKHDVRTQVL